MQPWISLQCLSHHITFSDGDTTSNPIMSHGKGGINLRWGSVSIVGEQSIAMKQFASKLVDCWQATALACWLLWSKLLCNQLKRMQSICGLHVRPKTCDIHGLGGEGSCPIDALPLDTYMNPTSIPLSLCPHFGGSLVVEQPLPLGDRGELEGPRRVFAFGNCVLCVVFCG